MKPKKTRALFLVLSVGSELEPFGVFSGFGVNLQNIALFHEKRDLYCCSGFQYDRLGA